MNRRDEQIEVTLTDEEVKTAGEELARKLAEIRQLAEKRKAANAEFKAQREGLEADVSWFGDAVTTRRRMLTIAVEDRLNDAGEIDIFRPDTGEVLRTREATPAERQGNLYTVPSWAVPEDVARTLNPSDLEEPAAADQEGGTDAGE